MATARTLKVVPVCAVCGKEVGTTQDDKAYRHGFNRFVTKPVAGRKRGQEDGKSCDGSGQDVVYKRATKQRAKVK